MYSPKLLQSTVNAVRLADVLQVLVRHGFAGLLRQAGFHKSLPARVLHSLKLMEAPSGPPETLGSRLRDALTELGPTFIKFGQILSTRPDIVGEAIAKELTQLQDKVTSQPYEKLAAVFESSFQAQPEAIFATFDTTAIAAASLSQVYRAELPTGEDVAVKIQRPDLRKTIEADLKLMRQVAEWLAHGNEEFNWFDPVGVVDEFSRSLQREMDFTAEARIIQQFRQNFEDREDVFIPEVFEQFSSDTVLTLTWVDGVPIDHYDDYEARNCDRKTIANNACEILCEMVLDHHFFHADPHPGNIFITYDNQIAFLDLGMSGHVEESDAIAFADLLYAVFSKDAARCVQTLQTLTPGIEMHQRKALEHELSDFLAFEAQAIFNGGQVSRGLEEAIRIIRRYHLELSPRFSLLLKSLGTIESVGRALSAEIDMVSIMKPHVERLLLQRYHPARVLKETQRNMEMLLRLSREAPEDLGWMLHQIRKGKFRIQIAHEQLDQLSAALEHLSNRSAISMITAAIIVGSSLVIVADSPFSRFGVAGFTFAGLLGIGLIISILWRRKY